MESRLEKYIIKKKKRKNKLKHLTIYVFLFLLLILCVNIVDNSFRELLCINDRKVMKYEYIEDIHHIHLFGQDYLIAQSEINNKIIDVKTKIAELVFLFKMSIEKITDKISPYIKGLFIVSIRLICFKQVI